SDHAARVRKLHGAARLPSKDRFVRNFFYCAWVGTVRKLNWQRIVYPRNENPARKGKRAGPRNVSKCQLAATNKSLTLSNKSHMRLDAMEVHVRTPGHTQRVDRASIFSRRCKSAAR